MVRPFLIVVMVSDPDGSLKREAHVAGYSAYALMFATVVWGMLTTSGTVRRSVRRQTIYGTHMVLSIMALSFTALHAMSHLFKKSNPMSPLRELVPFMSEFHVTLGVIAFELMIVAAVSASPATMDAKKAIQVSACPGLSAPTPTKATAPMAIGSPIAIARKPSFNPGSPAPAPVRAGA